MNNFEHQSTLSEIITSGGVDDDSSESVPSLSSAHTKKIHTKFGDVTVGSDLSHEMTQKFQKYLNDYRGDLFDTTSLGRTSQEASFQTKNATESSPTTVKYLPLNPLMQSEAKTLVQRLVDLGVIEYTTEKATELTTIGREIKILIR